MRVKVISEMSTAKGMILPGRIIEIPDALLARLVGKVEAIDLLASHSAEDLPPVKLELVPKRREVKAPWLDRQADTIPPAENCREGIRYASSPRCRWCSSTDLWTTFQGDTRCRGCHPPAPGAERSGHPPG